MASRTLAIMFTDIKGFTDRTSAASRDDVTDLLRRHEELLVPAFEAFSGTIVKTIGDAFLVTFAGPTDAVLCGIAIQEVLRQYNATAEEKHRIDVRIAINVGDVEVTAGDVYGEPVNIAARLEGIAEAGQVYFTEAVYQTMNRREVPSAEIGERIFKGIPHPIRVYKVVDDLDVDLARSLAERVRLGGTGRKARERTVVADAGGNSRRRLRSTVIAVVGAAVVAGGLTIALVPDPRARALGRAAELVERGQPAAALEVLDPALEAYPDDGEVIAQAVAAARAQVDRLQGDLRHAEAREWLSAQIDARPQLDPLFPEVALLDAEATVQTVLADPAASARYMPKPIAELIERAPGRADAIEVVATRLARAVQAGRWPEPMTVVVLYEKVLELDPARASEPMREDLCATLETGPIDDARRERAERLLLAHFREGAIAWARDAVAAGSATAVPNAYLLLAEAGDARAEDPVVRAKYALTKSPSFYSNEVRDELDRALETFRTVEDTTTRAHILELYKSLLEQTGIERRQAQLREAEQSLRAAWESSGP